MGQVLYGTDPCPRGPFTFVDPFDPFDPLSALVGQLPRITDAGSIALIRLLTI